jgi:hypothetical protein
MRPSSELSYEYCRHETDLSAVAVAQVSEEKRAEEETRHVDAADERNLGQI